ncbi:MAG: type II toxin-antitoxin system prevent-host-death family antitoxin [Chromatiaceae bacterium]
MHTVNMHEAKTQLSSLVQQALNGEDVVIARAGKPLVRLVPFQKTKQARQPGRLKGQIRMHEEIDAGDDAIVELFEDGA